MNPFCIAIAGGSGAGKSTLAHTYVDTYPDRVSVLHLDDYRKGKDLLPRTGSFINWDHPTTITWEYLVHDIRLLKEGRPLVIHEQNERFDRHGVDRGEQSRVVTPKQILLLDGYLALWHPDVRALVDFSLFLDVSHDARIARRKKFNDVEDSQEYFDAVLIPMHNEFVEPTKQYAHEVWDVQDIPPNTVFERFETCVRDRFGAWS